MINKIEYCFEDLCGQLAKLLFSNFDIIRRDKRFPGWENRYFGQYNHFLELHRVDFFTESLI